MTPVRKCLNCGGARARKFCPQCGFEQPGPTAADIQHQKVQVELAQKRAKAESAGDEVGEYFYGFLERVAARRT